MAKSKSKYLIILLLICLSCSHKITKGIVRQKDHQPETLIFIPITITCGKNCSNTILIPMFLAESWSVEVEGINNKKKITTETFYIPQAEWNLTKIGDNFNCIKNSNNQNICKTERTQYSKEKN